MKKHSLVVLALVTTAAIVQAGDTQPLMPPIPPPSHPESILDSIHLMGSARLRFEHADIDGKEKAALTSLRTRFGFKTDSIHGFKFLAEGEHTWILSDTDRYTAFPPFPNNNRSIIADPDNFELNRVLVSYASEALDTTVTAGRQYIKFADERFIGAVGWRQNDQTFDAVVLENKSVKNLTFTYAFINQVNRIFGDSTPAEAS